MSNNAYLEEHFDLKYFAKLYHLHRDTLRPFFEDHPDVLKIVRPETRLKRGYTTLRIPRSVAEQVHSKLCSGIPLPRCRSRRRGGAQ